MTDRETDRQTQKVGHTHAPCGVDLIREAEFLGSNEHVGDEAVEQLAQVAVPVDLEAVRHYLARQAVAAEQRLHAVGDLHLTNSIQTMHGSECDIQI